MTAALELNELEHLFFSMIWEWFLLL